MLKNIPKYVMLIYFSSVVIFSISVILLIKEYPMLNKDIITHIDFKGNPDKKGDRIHLVYALLVNFGLLIWMFLLIKYPKYASYPTEINDENRDSMYLTMRYFLSVISLGTSISFFYMIWIQSPS